MKTTMQENRKSRTNMNVGKKLFIVLFSLGLAYGASAQRGGHGGFAVGHGGGFYGGGYYPRTYVGVGVGFGYPYGWYGPWGYPYAYPPYYYGYGAMPTQLELQIKDIKNDFDQQIKDVRHDKALSHSERRQKIDQLKADRDNAVVQARHDYFNHSRQYYQQQQGNGNQNQPNQQNQNQQTQPNSPKGGSSNNEGPEYQDQGSNTAGSK